MSIKAILKEGLKQGFPIPVFSIDLKLLGVIDMITETYVRVVFKDSSGAQKHPAQKYYFKGRTKGVSKDVSFLSFQEIPTTKDMFAEDINNDFSEFE